MGVLPQGAWHCVAHSSGSLALTDSDGFADGGVLRSGGFGGAELACTQADAGVLTPIGQKGCSPNQTLVYRKPVAGSAGSAISSAGATGKPVPSMVTACTDTKCAPGQVAVVSYQALALPDAGRSGDAPGPVADASAPMGDARSSSASDSALAVVDSGSLPDGASFVDSGPVPASDAGPAARGATPVAVADASVGPPPSASEDAGVIGIPCGAVVTCVDAPPSCPSGRSPSYAPSGKWHCMPLCDTSSSNAVLITYGSSFGNTTVCADEPPANACPQQGDVWTWDYQNEDWACQPECDDGAYDQHVYGGQTVCVPC